MKSKFTYSFKNIFFFLYHWLCVGFFLGTLILMGPVRWLANFSRANNWSESKEKMFVIFFILILIIVSFLISRLITFNTIKWNNKFRSISFIIISFLVFSISLWFWMNPKMMIDENQTETNETISGTEFIFGSYPEKDKLIELKNSNYTAVISLLSPAVVPFEPVLINQENDLAKELGIELIHIPMLPWISDNENIEEKLEEIVNRGAGKYYVHCYLGKDRVNVFKKLLGSISNEIVVKSIDPENIRTLYDIKKFERGDITILDSNAFFIPYPTDEEFFGYILNGSIKTIVSFLNPENKDDLPWIEKEKSICEKYNVDYYNYTWIKLSPSEKEELVRNLIKLEKPIAFHAFNTKSLNYNDFIEMYNKFKNE